MNREIKQFCKENNLTEEQFYETEKVGGYLDLRSLTSIPAGFNPTVGGYLYLSSGLKCNKINIEDDYVFEWRRGKYIKVDNLLSEVLHKRGNIRKVKIVGKTETSFLVTDGNSHWSHGETLKKANEDLQFKIVSERLKNEPIGADTIITINHYRLITGACELGVKSWMATNNFAKEEIKASELLPLLEKTNAYGLDRFKALITF